MSPLPEHVQKASPIAFPVDDVVPAERPILTEPLSDFIAKRFHRKVLVLPDSSRAVANTLRDAISHRVPPRMESWLHKVSASKCHPLIDAVGTAFSQHRPLTLSPDAIWLVIEQGFSHHIAENAESFRSRLVRHSGRRELSSTVLGLSEVCFESAIADFSSQIRKQSDPVLHQTLICDFSTTTASVRTASEVVLMDSYSSFFDYTMACVCGIPRISLTGTLEDWREIRARVEVLETFELGWWVPRLRPILDQFIRTVEGSPDLEFWQAIYKPKQSYVEESVTGWIADLFPYLGDYPARRRNSVLNYERRAWAMPVDKGVTTSMGPLEPGSGKGAGTGSFPSGISSVPVNLTLPVGKPTTVDLIGGFLAVEQDSKDLALSPAIGWCVLEQFPANNPGKGNTLNSRSR